MIKNLDKIRTNMQRCDACQHSKKSPNRTDIKAYVCKQYPFTDYKTLLSNFCDSWQRKTSEETSKEQP